MSNYKELYDNKKTLGETQSFLQKEATKAEAQAKTADDTRKTAVSRVKAAETVVQAARKAVEDARPINILKKECNGKCPFMIECECSAVANFLHTQVKDSARKGRLEKLKNDCTGFPIRLNDLKEVVMAYETEKPMQKDNNFNCGDVITPSTRSKKQSEKCPHENMKIGGSASRMEFIEAKFLHEILGQGRFLTLVSRLMGPGRKVGYSSTASNSKGKGYGIDGKTGSDIRGHFFIPGLV